MLETIRLETKCLNSHSSLLSDGSKIPRWNSTRIPVSESLKFPNIEGISDFILKLTLKQIHFSRLWPNVHAGKVIIE